MTAGRKLALPALVATGLLALLPPLLGAAPVDSGLLFESRFSLGSNCGSYMVTDADAQAVKAGSTSRY